MSKLNSALLKAMFVYHYTNKGIPISGQLQSLAECGIHLHCLQLA